MSVPETPSALPFARRRRSGWAVCLTATGMLLIAAACHRAGENAPPPAEVRILMYHHIGAAHTNRWWVPTADFASQLRTLREQGFVSVLPADLVTHQAGRQRLPARAVLLTFDDGGADLLTEAEPLLREYGFTGVVYLITGLIAAEGEPRREYEGVPCLTWPEVNTLIRGGHLFPGGHTRTSPDLRRTHDVDHEIAGCREDIRRHTGFEADSFCYPFGRYLSNAVAVAVAAGFTTALTCEPGVARLGPHARLMELPRLHVVGGDSLEVFVRKIETGR